jgi:hypothetical protein
MRKLLALALFLTSATIFAQGTITGTVVDADMNTPLPGANVKVVGTSTGTITDFDGKFSLDVQNSTGTIEITFLGFEKRSIKYNVSGGTQSLGNIGLNTDADALAEVVIVGSGLIDLERDRKTPIAVSTIGRAEIQRKAVGNVELVEAIKNTPSVYVSNQAGGFGDSQMFLRGFDQSNTAFLLNGQPINGMEDGNMYWSNWSGMADVANAIQVQRGLGSSKLAISSVGGTVNIVSRAASRTEGGFARLMTGNDSYFKSTVSYDSGLDGKWAYSFLLDHWQAHRKYAEGTEGIGQNYFFAVGYVPNESHSFNFLLTGAPQSHGQNFSVPLEDYEEFGRKHNSNSGFLNGERYTIRKNYYHKPVANLNWDWIINDELQLSSVLYASWGRGGGTGPAGSSSTLVPNGNGGIDFDAMVRNNIESADENGFGSRSQGSNPRRMSVNNHDWYGFLTNLEFNPTDNWSLNVGVDARMYTGHHWYQMNDLLGLQGYKDNYRYGDARDADYVITETFKADPWSALFNSADPDQRFNYDYSEDINYLGGFGQAEYTNEGFSAFVQGAISGQSYQREGRAEGVTINGVNGLGKSAKVNKVGYNVKGGLGYTFAEAHTFFGNVGVYSRQPYLDNIFEDVRNSNYILEGEEEVDNEEITGYELGYRFTQGNVKIDFNAYHTEWGNRFVSGGFIPGDSTATDAIGQVDRYQRFTDVTQIHRGLELEAQYRFGNLNLRAYGSLGDWQYDGSTPIEIRNNETNELLAEENLDLTGTKVGNAPQTSFGVGFRYDFGDGLSIDADYNYYEDLYGFVNASDVIDSALEGVTYQSEELPAYYVIDAGISYKFNFGGNNLVFRGNVYNVANYQYLSQRDSYGYYYGNGRTWNASVRYNF